MYDISEVCEKLSKALGLPVVLVDGTGNQTYATVEIRSPLGHKLLSVTLHKSYDKPWDVDVVTAVESSLLSSMLKMLS